MLTGAVAPWPTSPRVAERESALGALRGSARIVTVHGPAGVGKSQFLTDLGEALGVGFLVIPVSGSGILSAIPLGALYGQLGDLDLGALAGDPPRLFAEATAALARLAGDRQVVVLADDIAALDSVSLTLLAQLAAAGRARLVATLRQAMPEPLFAAWNGTRDTRIDLRPLDVDAVRGLLETYLGGQVAQRAAAALSEQSGGDPFYLRELVTGALASGSLSEAEGIWQLTAAPDATPSLNDLVLARLRQIDPRARALLERIAVCGRVRAEQLPGDGVRDLLALLEREQLVVIDADGVSASQPIYATVLTSSLSRLQVEDILVEQADALDATGRDPVRVASWRIEAGRDADPAVVVTAAELASWSGDPATVLRLTEAGLRREPDNARLRVLRADALMRRGQSLEALSVLSGLERDEAVVRLTALATHTQYGADRGLATLEGADPASALVALTRSLLLSFALRPLEAEAEARRAATLLDGPDAAALVARHLAVPLAAQGRDAEAVAAADLACAEAEDQSDAQFVRALVHHLASRYDVARTVAVNALAGALERGDEAQARNLEYLLGRIALGAGHLDQAERWFRETLSAALTVGPPGLVVAVRADLAEARAFAGRTDTDPLDPAEAGERGIISQGWNALRAGDSEKAVADLVASARSWLERGNRVRAAVTLQVLVELDRPGPAVALLREIADGVDNPMLLMLADHAAAAASSDADALLALSTRWEQMGELRFAAVAAATASRALRKQGSARAASAARLTVERIATECGLDTPALQFGDGITPLTPREEQIASLAANGLSSKDIAASLVLSTRTVDNHLQSIYGKLGIKGRQDLRDR